MKKSKLKSVFAQTLKIFSGRVNWFEFEGGTEIDKYGNNIERKNASFIKEILNKIKRKNVHFIKEILNNIERKNASL